MREGVAMRGLLGAGVALLIAGLILLALPMFTYTDRHKAVDIGPLEVETQTERHIPVPRVLGIVTAGAGVILIVVSQMRARARV